MVYYLILSQNPKLYQLSQRHLNYLISSFEIVKAMRPFVYSISSMICTAPPNIIVRKMYEEFTS